MLDFTNFTNDLKLTTVAQDTEQTVTVRHNPFTGEEKIIYSRLDAFQALGLLADAFYRIWKDNIKPASRPPFASGTSKVCIQVDENTLSISFGTVTGDKTISDPVVAKGILLAAWVGLCEKTSNGEFDPREAFAGMLEIRK